MFDAILQQIIYIKDIPTELLDEAITAGELRVGNIIGLYVRPKLTGDKTLIELKLQKKGQERLLQKGQTLPLKQCGQIYCLREEWRDFLGRRNQTENKSMSVVLPLCMRSTKKTLCKRVRPTPTTP
ncbi:MAG: hypothetical protein GF334_07705 [Candidatus Altiarchaeales archaeon]|nr:hypothetical protein [Candidatus Altiarchaeales archaeon]